MLVLVNLFEFEVVVALKLRVATHERISGFTQVVFEKTVAGLDESCVLSFKHTRLVLSPRKPSKFSQTGLTIKPLDIADLGDYAGGKHRANARNRSQSIGYVLELALNLFTSALIWAFIARMEEMDMEST